MAALLVDEVWGVSRRISKKLESMGIKTVLNLADTDIRFIRKHFNVVLERTVRELYGEACLRLEEFAPTKQEIVCFWPFGGLITEYEDMHQAICCNAVRGTEKLRGEHQYFAGMYPRLLRPALLLLMNDITANWLSLSCSH